LAPPKRKGERRSEENAKPKKGVAAKEAEANHLLLHLVLLLQYF
jgi:hypothetical protein